MLKRLLTCILALGMVLAFTACDESTSENGTDNNNTDTAGTPAASADVPAGDDDDDGSDSDPAADGEPPDDSEEADADIDDEDEDDGYFIGGIGQLYSRSFAGVTICVESAGFVVGESYTIEYTVERQFVPGFRVRYTGMNDAGVYDFAIQNDNTNNAHSSPSAESDGNVANQIPAVFREGGGIDQLSEGVIIVNFTFGEDIPDLDPPYMEFISLFGLGGESGYDVLSVTIKDSDGNVMATRSKIGL